MYKRLASLVININRINPIHPTMSNEIPSDIKPKKKWRNKYRVGKYISPDKRNKRIMSDLKTNTHIDDIIKKYNFSSDYIAYLMFLHRYTIHEITNITGINKHRLLDIYLIY
tara:strand:+ start:244 stop:579 length:336 start_codon:yes stop_codon:yes gene_type:complete